MNNNNKNAQTPRILDLLSRKAAIERLPFAGTFELTPLCNFDCKMCYIHTSSEEVASLGGLRSTEEWIKIAQEAFTAGMMSVLITGGEPFIYSGFRKVYKAFSEMGLIVTINTNASQITEKDFELFVDYPPRRMNVSLYGASDEAYQKLCGRKNVFSTVVANIKRLREIGVSVKINATTTPVNIGEFEKVLEIAADNKCIVSHCFYLFPPAVKSEAYIGDNPCRFDAEEAGELELWAAKVKLPREIYVDRVKKSIEKSASVADLDEDCGIATEEGRMICRAGRSSFWIRWNGQMTGCGMLPKPYALPFETGFKAAWERVVEFTNNEITTSAECAGCKLRSVCTVCAARAYAETGSTAGTPEYVCRYTKSSIKASRKEYEELKKAGEITDEA